MTRILVKEATQEQLLAFARDTLGLSCQPNTGRIKLIAKVQAAWDKDYITVPEAKEVPKQEGPEPKPVKEAAPMFDAEIKQEKVEPPDVKIKIHIQEGAGGREPVQLGVNGAVMLVERDVECMIPYKYFHALENAIKLQYDMMPDGQTLNPTPREVSQYPFTRFAA